jgi:hypothetical protein
MTDLIINIRFIYWHLQVSEGWRSISWEFNEWQKEKWNKNTKWIKVIRFYNYSCYK